jgi:succinyl-CoA synthetase beta subunit
VKIHEYQAKAILATFGVPVPKGEVAVTPQEAVDIAKRLGGPVAVVKAQIHAGGRGKGGGVKVSKGLEAVAASAKAILGMHLVTHQTGPAGQRVGRVLVEEGLAIKRELYVGLLVDRSTRKPVFMASADGGMDIEEVAARTPERIHKAFIEPGIGLAPFQAQQLAFAIGLTGDEVKKATKIMLAFYQAFIATDASLLEINPLIVTRAATCSRSTPR